MRPHRGEIWEVRFDPSVGAEIQKVRPAVVMNLPSVGRLPLCIVVPITHWNPIYSSFSWIIPLSPTAENGLSKESGADTFQLKSLSENRFIRRLGTLQTEQVDTLAAAIALCVGYTP